MNCFKKQSQSESTNRFRPTRSTRSSSIVKQDVYIQIPLSVMSGNVSPSSPVEGQKDEINYKLTEGFPSYAEEKIRKRKSYVMSYNTETKNAEWVYEILNESTLKNTCKEHMSFGKNELENRYYQQGHLAAAANHRWCQEAYHDTYLMSNMIPQDKNLNQGMWKKLEKHCQKLQQENRNCKVHVYTGPLYLKKKPDWYDRVPNPSEMNRMGGKVIPTHLFKVIIVEDEDGTVKKPQCYVMPNEEPEHDNLDVYRRYTIKDIEAFTGLTFIQRHPSENMRDYMKTVTLQGEVGNGELHTVNIYVRISS